jgi:hypothetical protein
MKRIWGITTVALLALTGCASTGSTASLTSSTSAAPAASSSETPTATASAKSKIVESICKDSTKDGVDGVDLKSARLLSDGSLLFVEYELASDIPASGRILFSVMASSPDGETSYQIGTSVTDGAESSNFIFNLGTATQYNITNRASINEETVAVRYPLGDLEGLQEGFRWAATVSVDGDDVDRCPADDGMDLSNISDKEWWITHPHF